MKKRVGLARAIVTNPDFVLYDEPTAGLDPIISRQIDLLIDRLRRTLGITSIVVTHDLYSALRIGSHIAMLHQGKIITCSIQSPCASSLARSTNGNRSGFVQSRKSASG